MTERYRDKPTDWDCRVFIAVVENGTHEAAARQLAEMRDNGYSRQSVGRIIIKLQHLEGETLLQRKADGSYTPTPAGERFVAAARQIVAVYDRVDSATDEPTVWTLACAPHHAKFVAMAEEQLRELDDVAGNIRVEYLDRADRGEHQFQREPVDRLLRKELRLIIGPRVSKNGLRSTKLYAAQLEAMIDCHYRGDRLLLADLVTRYEALLQPHDIRARRVLEDAIRTAGVTDPGAVRVALETHEIATSVMRLRTERPRPAGRDRVVVVPSDVGQPYKDGMEFGGRNADRFKWIPIHDGSGTLRLETWVTIRNEDRKALSPVIDALEAGVNQLDQGRHPISGTIVPGRSVPAQRA